MIKKKCKLFVVFIACVMGISCLANISQIGQYIATAEENAIEKEEKILYILSYL